MTRIVAEIGINHSGSVDKAIEMIRQARIAGADSVKFQNFKAEKMYTPYFKSYIENKPLFKDNAILDFFKQFEFSEDEYQRLKKCADDQGVDFFSAPFDEESFDFLVKIGVKRIKIASSSLNDYFLLKKAASSGLEIIASTGLNGLSEIDSAVSVLKPHKPGFTLLHCVSLYPPEDSEVNLRRMISLKDRYNCPVGFSDHSADEFSSVAAVSMGACIIEKHFMLENDNCPDSAVSLNPEQFKNMTDSIRRAEKILGTGGFEISEKEASVARSARMSITAKSDIPKGAVITENMIVSRRPGTGISPMMMASVIGKKTVEDIPADTILDFKSLI